MATRKSKKAQEPVTVFSYIGNIGCIRFPIPIRKVSGIKRDDRLLGTVQGAHTIVLEKLDVPKWVTTEELADLKVEGCACAEPPKACADNKPNLLAVGWSYVNLPEPLAVELGFFPDAPIKLIGEASRVIVSLHENERDLEGVKRVICPP